MKCLITVAGRPQEHTITNVKTGLLKGHERGNTEFFFFFMDRESTRGKV